MLSQVKNMLQLRSIKGNIILSLIAMGALTLFVTLVSHWFSLQLQEHHQRLSRELVPAQLALESTKAALANASLHQLNYAASSSGTDKAKWAEEWKKIDDQSQLLASIRLSLPDAAANLDKTMQLLGKIRSSQEKVVLTDQQPDYGTELAVTQLHDQLSLLQAKLLEQSSSIEAAQLQAFNYLGQSNLALFILTVIIGCILGYFVVSQIFRSLYHIKLAVKELSMGNLPEKIRVSNNETSHILKELTRLTGNLRGIQQFALRVGKGEFSNDINVFNNSGELGSSLYEMRNSLLNVAIEDKQRNWINEGFALFGDLLRTHNNSIAELCEVMVSQLVKYVGANQGAIFLKEESAALSEEVLKLQACYAYDRKKYIGKEILKGEGLCGQAWLENDVILIDDVPENYVSIRSGLGGANPKNVLIIPLTSNEVTQGVLELASFGKFEAHQLEFVRKVAENLASAISTTRSTEKTQQLLAEFQELTEEMRAQEEEMRQNMEELKATQEEMARAQGLIIHKENNLNSVINNTSDTIFAIDGAYKITVVNQVLASKYKKMGILLEEGTCIRDILPPKAWEVWKPRYDRALAGEQFSLIEESSGSNGTRYAQTYHNPILDESGAVIGVSVISRDVTEVVVAQQENERKRSTLRSLIDFTDDTYFAIDTDYRILIANKTLKERFASSGISLEEGDNIFDKLPKDQHSTWKERYDKALAGESFMLTTERQVKDKTLIIEVHHQPILDAQGRVIGASVISKDISRWHQLARDKELAAAGLSQENLQSLKKQPPVKVLAEKEKVKSH